MYPNSRMPIQIPMFGSAFGAYERADSLKRMTAGWQPLTGNLPTDRNICRCTWLETVTADQKKNAWNSGSRNNSEDVLGSGVNESYCSKVWQSTEVTWSLWRSSWKMTEQNPTRTKFLRRWELRLVNELRQFTIRWACLCALQMSLMVRSFRTM